MSLGIPIKLLHEAEGHTITLETKSGDLYRGLLVEAEDNMNCTLSQIKMTHKDGHVSHLERIFVRGSKIRMVVVPDMLKNAAMFKRQKEKEDAKAEGANMSRTLRARARAKAIAAKRVKKG